MTDQDSIERRERIFDQLRVCREDFDKLNSELQLARSKINEKRDEINKLAKLVDIMLADDCCPVEAQLKYADEIDDYSTECDDASESKMSSRRYSKVTPLSGSTECAPNFPHLAPVINIGTKISNAFGNIFKGIA